MNPLSPLVAARLPSTDQTQAVFVQLDPILKNLLETVTKYRDLSEAFKSDDSISNKELFTEKWVSCVKRQLELLRHLQSTIQNLGPSFAPSLLVLADYVSLPLKAIFHISPPASASAESASTAHEDDENYNNVLTSHLRALHCAAADCIRAYVQAVTPPTFPPNDDGTDTSAAAAAVAPSLFLSLASKHSIPFLVALTRGIPTTTSITSTIQNRNANLSALDDGSDCWLAILFALKTVLKVCPVEELLHALEGGMLVIRLVDCATTLVEGIVSCSNVTVRLEAVQLIDRLLNQQRADDPMVWQEAVFPGVLVALYRCLLSCHRQASTGQSVALECACLECIQTLLRITLVPIHKNEHATATTTTATTSNPTTILQNLQLLARNANEMHHSLSAAASSEQDSKQSNTIKESSVDFLSQVQQRAVTPLIILLKQSMASKASSVCLQATQLCKVILVETTTCWRGTLLPENAMGCCLILQNASTDATVAQVATSVLQAYEQQLGSRDLVAVVSKIRSLVAGLPTLSQGGKEVDLKLHLQLLKGYVQALGPHAAKELGVSTFPYQPLIQLMEVDFSATAQPSRPLPVFGVSGRDSSSAYRKGHHSKLPIQRLTLDNAKLAGDVIESLGVALGEKQGAFVVDALLSDVFEGWASVTPNLLLLKEWAASLFVATKVFIGAFTPHSCCELELSAKKKAEKRRRNILLSLSSSILPLLAHVPVPQWRPTVYSGQSNEDGLRPSQRINQGIASILVLSLELQSVITSFLGKDVEEFVTILLYPTIDKVHDNNCSIAQEAALDVLRSMACACGIKQVSHLLQREAVRLFSDMLCRLRVPGGSSLSPGQDTGETIAVVSSLTWVLEEILKANMKEDPFLVDEATLSGLTKLCNTLMDRLDHLLLNKVVAEDDTIKITVMHSAFFRYMIILFESDRRINDANQEEKIESVGGSWMELLSDFRLSKEGFGVQDVEDFCPERNRHESCTVSNGRLTISTSEIDLSSRIISMSYYLLSNQCLRVQISACESLTSGFQFLALASKEGYQKDKAEIKNAVYRQVATSWSSIKARLSNVTDEVVEKKLAITSLLIVSPSQASISSPSDKDIPSKRYFLSRMFQLVASMFECSGDFMADRFKSSVWPVIAKQLKFLLDSQERKYRRGPSQRVIQEVAGTSQENELNQWSDSERHLLLSMTHCLTRIFGCADSRGTCLVRIHQAVGLVLLPFLGDSDDGISSSAMAAIKNIVAQDCDILLRPLLEMSGRGIPPCSLRVSRRSHRIGGDDEVNGRIVEVSSISKTAPEQVAAVHTRNSKLRSGCKEILDLIDQLPEQELL